MFEGCGVARSVGATCFRDLAPYGYCFLGFHLIVCHVVSLSLMLLHVLVVGVVIIVCCCCCCCFLLLVFVFVAIVV